MFESMQAVRLNNCIASLSSQKKGDERSNLINAASLLVLETVGRAHSSAAVAAKHMAPDFGSRLNSQAELDANKTKTAEDILYYCAANSVAQLGLTVDRDDRATFCSRDVAKNDNYMFLLSGIMKEVQAATRAAVTNEMLGEMASTVLVDPGKTCEIEVETNAIFQWYDSSWTGLRAIPVDRIANRFVTANPRVHGTQFEIDWNQFLDNPGALIDTMAAVSAGYARLLMSKFTTAFTTAAADTANVPASLKKSGFNNSNWDALVRAVAAANRTRVGNLIAYGDYLALTKIVGNGDLATAVMTAVGAEYIKNGYLSTYKGVALYEVAPTMKDDFSGIWPTDTVVVAARANSRYNPMVIAFDKGAQGDVTLKADEFAATGKIHGIATASFDIIPVFASYVGVMSSIS